MNYKTLMIPLIFVVLVSGCTTQPDVQRFTSEEGHFSILMTGTPKESTQIISTRIGPVSSYMFSVEDNGINYVVSYVDLPPELVEASGSEAMLDGARAGLEEGVADVYRQLTKEIIISIEGHPGREISVTMSGNYALKARIYLVNNRLYTVAVKAPRDRMFSKPVSDFLNSFDLI